MAFQHDRGCPLAGLAGHSDGARRIYETYHLHRLAGDMFDVIGKWFAAKLSDGTTDNVLYDTKAEAISHQHHNENYYTFICISPANMTVCSAEVMLTLARKLYDAGLRQSDPGSAARDVIKRSTFEDQVAYLRGRPANLIIGQEER